MVSHQPPPAPAGDHADDLFPADHLRQALDQAARAGSGTDTIAAIAGGLLGAAGALQRALPQWRRILHGWPGPGSRDLIALGQLIAAEDRPTMRCTVRSRDVRVSKLPTRT